jgi:hypothetical protein
MEDRFQGFEIEDGDIDDTTDAQWLEALPALNKHNHEFIIKLDLDNEVTIFVGARELYWHEMMNIEAYSFRKGIDDTVYLAGEQERREILRKAVLWVATLPDREFETNEDGQILSKLKFEIVEYIWEQYQPKVFLGATEAAALYNAAAKYFNGEAQANSPVPSIIIEVDMMLKFGGLSRAELREISTTEMERMQTVFMARAEAIGLGVRNTRKPMPQVDETDAEDLSEWESTMPPGVREGFNSHFMNGFDR